MEAEKKNSAQKIAEGPEEIMKDEIANRKKKQCRWKVFQE